MFYPRLFSLVPPYSAVIGWWYDAGDWLAIVASETDNSYLAFGFTQDTNPGVLGESPVFDVCSRLFPTLTS